MIKDELLVGYRGWPLAPEMEIAKPPYPGVRSIWVDEAMRFLKSMKAWHTKAEHWIAKELSA